MGKNRIDLNTPVFHIRAKYTSNVLLNNHIIKNNYFF